MLVENVTKRNIQKLLALRADDRGKDLARENITYVRFPSGPSLHTLVVAQLHWLHSRFDCGTSKSCQKTIKISH